MNMICMKQFTIWHFIFTHKFEIQFILVIWRGSWSKMALRFYMFSPLIVS